MSTIKHLSALINVLLLSIAVEYDEYGIIKLHTSVSNGLDFVPNWSNIDRTIIAVNTDKNSTNKQCTARGSNAVFNINSTNGIMTMSGDSPRYYCYVNHTNVEVTAYGKRGTENVISSTQGLDIVARSTHKDYDTDYCKAKGYFFRLYNTGKACFLKEFIHTRSGITPQCLIYASGNPCINDFIGDSNGIRRNVWYGIKLVIQNYDNIVNLRGYVDFTDGVHGGNWELILEYNDTNVWQAYVEIGDTVNEEYCMVQCGYDGTENWPQQSNSVFLRATHISDYQWKYFSIREIVPFQMYSNTTQPTNYPTKYPTQYPSSNPSLHHTIYPSNPITSANTQRTANASNPFFNPTLCFMMLIVAFIIIVT